MNFRLLGWLLLVGLAAAGSWRPSSAQDADQASALQESLHDATVVPVTRAEAAAAFETLDLEGLDPAVTARLERERGALTALLASQPAPDAPEGDAPRATNRPDEEGIALLVEAWGEAGLVAHAHGQYAAAATAYGRAATLAPTDSRWAHAFGLALRDAGDHAGAARSFRRAVALEPRSIAPKFYLAEFAFAEGRFDEAEALATAVETALPLSPAALDLLGRVALERGDPALAVERLEKALAQVPEANRLHYPLALAHRALGDLDTARAHLEARGPVGVKAPDGLLQAIEDRKTGERLLLLRGKRAFAAGRFVEAAAAFEQAAEAAPESAGARVNWSTALSQLGEFERAEAELRRALELEPENSTALFNLATLDLRSGRVDEAVARFERVAAADPSDLETQRQLGRAYARQGRYDEALTALDRVMSHDPRDELLQVARAEVLLALGRTEDAIEALEGLLRAMPTAGLPMHLLARALAAASDRTLRDGPRAVELATAVVGAAPTPLHRETLVLALSEAGRCAEAMDQADALLEALQAGSTEPIDSATARRLAVVSELRHRAAAAGSSGGCSPR